MPTILLSTEKGKIFKLKNKKTKRTPPDCSGESSLTSPPVTGRGGQKCAHKTSYLRSNSNRLEKPTRYSTKYTLTRCYLINKIRARCTNEELTHKLDNEILAKQQLLESSSHTKQTSM